MNKLLNRYSKFCNSITKDTDIKNPKRCKELCVRSHNLVTELWKAIILKYSRAIVAAAKEHQCPENFKEKANTYAILCEQQISLIVQLHHKALDLIVVLHRKAIEW